MPLKIISVVGARPNLMKIAPFIRAINEYNRQNGKIIEHLLVHTGQHYDLCMSDAFFRELNIPQPDINLGVGSGTHAEQVGNTMIEFEKVLQNNPCDWVVVVGDVNATLACSVTAKKEMINLCHIEAGLRSGDITMPEEINRLVTDRLADCLFTPDELSSENLRKEGVPEEKIKFVGNIMIDTLDHSIERAGKLNIAEILRSNILDPAKVEESMNIYNSLNNGFSIVTLHRPSNVDKKEILEPIVNFLLEGVSPKTPVIWPLHPRTKKLLEVFSLMNKVNKCNSLILLNPIGYLEMLRLNMEARILLTDSGGLQEECTVLGTPCLTLRRNTERPITLRENGGASLLVGNDIALIKKAYHKLLGIPRNPHRPALWDGYTAERIVKTLVSFT